MSAWRCRRGTGSERRGPVGSIVKRALDIAGASIALLVLSPVMLVCAALIWIRMGPPILFRQNRPGLHGQGFELVKFRTMLNAYDREHNVLPDEQRLTPLGRWLRRFSLDEIPELVNVLKGEMSLVGPRPLLTEYLPRYSPAQARRHLAKPGVTGWAQVNGRNAIDWETKFKLDVWYIENWSLWLDLRILVLTLWKVVRRDGISMGGHATMPPFLGTEERRDPAEMNGTARQTE